MAIYLAIPDTPMIMHEEFRNIIHDFKKLGQTEVYGLSRQWTGRKPKTVAYLKVSGDREKLVKRAKEWEESLLTNLLLKSKPKLRYFEKQ